MNDSEQKAYLTVPQSAPNQSESTAPTEPSGLRWYVLAIMTCVYALNIADRYVVSTLIQPIKAELKLTDAGVALVTGVSLAIFYVTAGLPLARLADRTSRRNVIAIAVAAWSGMTAMCGLAQTFGQFMLARIGVGVGEAGGTPPALSLLSDYFAWRQRAFAITVFSIGASLGSMLGSTAGYVSDAWGWRVAFMVLGVPGVAVAVTLFLTVREPRRGRLDAAGPTTAPATLRATCHFLVHQRALLHAVAAGTLWTLWSWGLMWWIPAFLARSHHMSVGGAGGALSLMHGLGGTTVLLLTALMMTRFETRDARIVPRLSAAIVFVATIPSILAVCVSSTTLALAMLWIFVPLSYALFGPVLSLVQNLVPASMRAQATALLMFTANIANLVIAPVSIGIASDRLAPAYGTESLRVALIPLACTGFWAAYHFYAVGQHLTAGLSRAGTTEPA
jgi:predicted MFS family arabinose efflux permease